MRDVPVHTLLNPDQTNAQAILHNLMRAQEAYLKDLPSGHRMVVYASANSETIRVDAGQWINPITIIFVQQPQKEGETRKVLVQHVSQLSVVLTSEERKDGVPEEPRRVVGFGPAE
jgi:hypothetical protein